MTNSLNDDIFTRLEAGAVHLNELATLGGWEEGFTQFVERLDNEALGQLLLQFPFTEGDERPNRKLALEVADILGPDYAQDLYRFAVLVTKLT